MMSLTEIGEVAMEDEDDEKEKTDDEFGEGEMQVIGKHEEGLKLQTVCRKMYPGLSRSNLHTCFKEGWVLVMVCYCDSYSPF